MRSVLGEITALRNGKAPVIDRRNSNRYCVVCAEEDGTKTAYCFGVPIYDSRSKRLLSLQFYENGRGWSAYGSGAVVTVTDEIELADEYGCCKIRLPEAALSLSGNRVRCGNAELLPTLNGILISVPCRAAEPFAVRLFSEQPFMPVRANDRCFSLMREQFKPFVTVSSLGVLNSAGQMIAPCGLTYQKNSDQEYALTVTHTSPYGARLLLEINLHAEKLFQDTTVESRHPEVNNAFGGTAFIGYTAAYGEQWLYSRPDLSKLPALYDKQIGRAVLHLPRFGGSAALTAFGLHARFCSFGSRWENRVEAAEKAADAVLSGGYQSLDVTDLITDKVRFLRPSEGFILRPTEKDGGFSAVSTGDSFFAPQILAVNFR